MSKRADRGRFPFPSISQTKKEPNGGLDENGVGPVLDNTATMLALEANAEDLLDATILAKRERIPKLARLERLTCTCHQWLLRG